MNWLAATGLIDHRALEQDLRRTLTDRERDLLAIASVALSLDRISARPQHSWERELTAQFPVRNPRFWAGEAEAALLELLEWITGDQWSFHFTLGGAARSPHQPSMELLKSEPPTRSVSTVVALHSGGLDSAAGLLSDPVARDADELLLVSAWTNGRMLGLQRDVAAAMNASFRPLRHLTGEIHSTKQVLGVKQAESSQRTRALAYFFLGLIAANSTRAEALRVYENAVGGINLPYLASQTGTRMSRAMHPKTLLLVTKLAQVVLDRDLRVLNPAAESLKSEMCAAVDDKFAFLLEATVSCDTAFAHRGPGGRHLCGECGSCLLRRQALRGADMQKRDIAGRYRFDLSRGADVDIKRADRFNAVDLQVSRLSRALDAPDAVAELLMAFPMLADLDPSTARSATTIRATVRAMVPLLQRHVSEWKSFAGTAHAHSRPEDQPTAKNVQLKLPKTNDIEGAVGV
jgi:hypothetical protein